MPSTGLPIQSVTDMINRRLSGWQNAVSSDQVLDALNDGVAEVWNVLKSFHQDYFGQSTQSTDSTQLNYFPLLTTSAPEYPLPEDLREVKFIECITSGYEELRFWYSELTDPEFRGARFLGNQVGIANPVTTDTSEEMLYTIVGKDRFILAIYPPVNLSITIWYIRSLPTYEDGDILDEILFPYHNKVADFAAKKLMLENQEPTAWHAWTQEWKQGILSLATGAGERNQADAQFVQDFLGD